MAETIQTVSIARETHERYLRYAVSVITARALPDVRDGLKPVQRRILYTMYNDLRLYFDGRPAKCARIVGDVMGKYHPHGDSAIYDALVRMAQPWVMRVPLVAGQGNFGSVDGDSAAAYRYTEAKLSAIADLLLREIRQNTVDHRPTYNSESTEPVVLPAEYPNLLVNGVSGIAVGMATNIPPHNLREVINACLTLIEDPEATTSMLMNSIKGPDFPLGGKILADRSTLRKIYEDGDGSIKVQAEWKLEGADGKTPQIAITSIPYGTDKSKIENDIGTIIEARKLPGALGLTNETNEKDGLRITIDLKPGTDPNLVMAYLFRHTALQANFSFNMTCLIPNEDGTVRPQKCGLKEILSQFLKFRMQTVRRRFEFELEQLRKRIHILEGFRIVFDVLDEALRLIRRSSGKADAAEKLIKNFGLDLEQANAVLEAQIYKIAQMEINKILEELAEKTKEANRIENILKSEKKLWKIIGDELGAIAEKFGERRKSRMAGDEDVLEFNAEAYIVKENTNVILTRDGWVKRVGRLASVEGTRVREGDEVIAVVPASTLDNVIFFAEDGTSYTIRVNEIPASSGYGEPISKFIKLGDNVRIIAMETTDPRFMPDSGDETGADGLKLVAVTSDGNILQIPFTEFRKLSTKNGRRYIRLTDPAKAIFCGIVQGTESILLASEKGYAVHFELSEVPLTQNAGKGVGGIKLERDRCVGAALVTGRGTMPTIRTGGGTTRELAPRDVPIGTRHRKGEHVVKKAGIDGIVPPPIQLVNWDELESDPKPKPTASKNGKAQPDLFD
ncbi:MAG: DNA topoisomerase IV subunit A [Zavarzinella sp.]